MSYLNGVIQKALLRLILLLCLFFFFFFETREEYSQNLHTVGTQKVTTDDKAVRFPSPQG